MLFMYRRNSIGLPTPQFDQLAFIPPPQSASSRDSVEKAVGRVEQDAGMEYMKCYCIVKDMAADVNKEKVLSAILYTHYINGKAPQMLSAVLMDVFILSFVSFVSFVRLFRSFIRLLFSCLICFYFMY